MKLPIVDPLKYSSAVFPTMAYIAYHAAQRPADTALIIDGSKISYQRFYQDIGKVLTVLRRLELGPQHVVGVEAPSSYVHLLVVLALEAVAVPTVSYHVDEIKWIKGDLAALDLIICRLGHEPPMSKQTLIIDDAWYASVMAESPEGYCEEVLIGAETPVRITKSSGTTGQVKWLMHTGRFYRSMLESYNLRACLNRRSRCLLTMGLHIQSFFWFSVACLRMGGTIVIPGPQPVAQIIEQFAITHCLFLPRDLARVVDSLPADYVKPANLTVMTISGPVSKAARARVQQKLTDDLIVGYGTSEVGVIGTVGDDGIGTVVPGMRVEVVDDDDQPVFGEVGRFRVMSPGSIGAYLARPEASREMFRDEWFYPGDFGVMIDHCTFELLGRSDDMFNVGGIKFLPHTWEEKLTKELPVLDLCLTMETNVAGIEQLCVVAVPDKAGNIDDLENQVSALMSGPWGEVKTVIVENIPRTGTGKLLRRKLNNMLS
jgi:acyl-coenzyme A synthetase/AMP-(fatty) acid ligase